MSEKTETTITTDTEILRLVIATIALHACIRADFTHPVASALEFANDLLEKARKT